MSAVLTQANTVVEPRRDYFATLIHEVQTNISRLVNPPQLKDVYDVEGLLTKAIQLELPRTNYVMTSKGLAIKPVGLFNTKPPRVLGDEGIEMMSVKARRRIKVILQANVEELRRLNIEVFQSA